ncbi:hypothetical protein SAMN04487969_12119 [Paenibacillus algorifonticola]|uniref:Uncharacterized protein n=1 Tax=Paenibacillus algorifonticola TaxID=684063 RepID=A0A1I2H9L0_9BACL|nr:hypothetical protein SAMN04487969_12119 [Paenibacillus algorifonticola]
MIELPENDSSIEVDCKQHSTTSTCFTCFEIIELAKKRLITPNWTIRALFFFAAKMLHELSTNTYIEPTKEDVATYMASC